MYTVLGAGPVGDSPEDRPLDCVGIKCLIAHICKDFTRFLRFRRTRGPVQEGLHLCAGADAIRLIGRGADAVGDIV